MNSYLSLHTAEKGLYSLCIQCYVYAVNIYLNVLVTEVHQHAAAPGS
jgi:hypothetical protein